MNRLDKYACMFRWDILMDAVTKVEDVAFTLAETCKYSRHFLFDAFRRGIKH